jgi:hypothetical protein
LADDTSGCGSVVVLTRIGLPLGITAAVVFPGMIVAGVGRHNSAMVVGAARSA